MADKITFKHTNGNTTQTVATYTDSKIDSLLSGKGDKTELAKKANSEDVYTKTEIDSKFDKKQPTGNYAHLGADNKIPSSELPSYVDDVLEGYLHNGNFYSMKLNAQNGYSYQGEYTGETGKIYVDLDTSKTYRFGGTAYVEISASLALGETSSTAYAGDKGKTNRASIEKLESYFKNGFATKANYAISAGSTTTAMYSRYLSQYDSSGNRNDDNYFTYDTLTNALNTKQGLLPATGNETTPVYVSAEGVISKCTPYSSASVKHASSADSATTASSAAKAKNADNAVSANSADSANRATKATQDGDGNVITSTYATKSTWTEADGMVTITLG